MSETDEKPEVRELLGKAFNASNLASDPDHERAADRIAAFAMAQALRPDDHPAELRKTREHRLLERELASMLWHAKYGQQQGAPVRAAEIYLAELLSMRSRQGYTESGLRAVARGVVAEWLSEVCPGCRGTGLQERTGRGGRRRPSVFARGQMYAVCAACRGSGRAARTDRERAAALGITVAWYRAMQWDRVWAVGEHVVRAVSGSLVKPLQAIRVKSRVRSSRSSTR